MTGPALLQFWTPQLAAFDSFINLNLTIASFIFQEGDVLELKMDRLADGLKIDEFESIFRLGNGRGSESELNMVCWTVGSVRREFSC